MFNLKIGNPNDFTNVEWVGINGSENGFTEVVIDLGEVRMLEWVGFHLLSVPDVGIQLPEELMLACSSKDRLWQGIDRWFLPIKPEETISEYLFANTEPISRECNRIKATLIGEHWIFVSEIEIVVEDILGQEVQEFWNSDLLIP